MIRILLSLTVIFTASCVDEEPECFRSTDCPGIALCEAGRCAAHVRYRSGETTDEDYSGPIVVAPSDAGSRTADSAEFEYDCPEASPGDLQIEEILSDVPTGSAGDANGDGVRDAYDDEFVEISNTAPHSVGLRGITLHVNEVEKYRFEAAECLEPMQVLVVFAGGPAGEGRRVAGKRLGLANHGGSVRLISNDQTVFASAEYGDGAVGSWVRQPAVVGDMVRHGQLATRLFSPGTCPDGSGWDAHCDLPSNESKDGGVGD